MGYMKSVDIVLSEYKLSDAQKNAVVELLSGGFNTAKPNTIKSLENKNLIIKPNDGAWELEPVFAAELKAAYSQPEPRDNFTEVLGWEPDSRENETDAKSLESLLQGDPWKLGDAITEDEAFIVLDSDGELKDAEGTEFDKFDSSWADWEKEVAGFGDTLDWKGTEVWNGLTAAEIAEDMETATPINRQARRTHFRTLKNAFRRATVQRPRKALKVTGKVGV